MSELEHWMTVTAQPRPANLHAHYDLGLCYLAAGNLPEALTHLIVAQRQDSDNVALCFLLGKVNERLGRRLDAVRFYKEALRVRPDCADEREPGRTGIRRRKSPEIDRRLWPDYRRPSSRVSVVS